LPDRSSFALRRPGWRVWIAGVLAVIVFVVLLIARLADAGPDSDQPGPSGVAASPSETASTTPEPTATLADDGLTGPEASPKEQVAAPAAMTAATDFARAWVVAQPGVTAQQWWEGVARHTDAALADQLREVDPAVVPAARVVGPAESIHGGVSSADVAVPTDAGRLLITCSLQKNRWLVVDFDIERGQS